MTVPTGTRGVSRTDRLLDGLEAIVPPPSAWFFALRIWLAMVLALYAGFWLQLPTASSAAVTVGILAQPKRGQALSKAGYRFLGTLVGGLVSILIIAAFNEDRVLTLVSYTLWLGLCVFAAQFLQDTRAYGAMLAGYTVGIIALTNLDSPQNAFDATWGRVAAITLGIAAITFINDALASPSTWQGLYPRLREAFARTRAFAHEALIKGDPGSERTGALIGSIAPMRADASAIAGELDDGVYRAAGARSCIAALYVMGAASRGVAAANARLPRPGAAVEEARAICLRALSGEVGQPSAAALERGNERLRDLVDGAVRDPQSPLDEVMALQRALDLHNAVTFADDGLRALESGHRPLRDVALPSHRDFPVALRAAIRVAVAFAVTAAIFVAAGLPQTSFVLVQVGATAALSSAAPDPRKFAMGVLIGMPLAALCAGTILFGILNGYQGFPLLAIAIAPPVFVACFLSLNPKTFGVGFIMLVFTMVLVSPENPQNYDPETFLMNAYLVVVAAIILFLVVRLVLPISPARQRYYALAEARRDTAEAMLGEGGDATTRTSLNSDRLFQFMGYASGSGRVRQMGLRHAFALARLESAAARAHAQMRLLWPREALRGPLARGRDALARGEAFALLNAAGALVAAGRSEERETRLRVARTATDLATAAQVLRRHSPFFRRIDLPLS